MDDPASRWRELRRELPPHVTLVAVTKGRPLDDVRALHAAGCRDFGENRADEMAGKAAALPDVRYHFIGNVQRNKLPLLRRHAVLVHSFDRPELAAAWAGPPVLVQVHLGGGTHRNGLPPEEVPDALDALAKAGVDVRGLSVLPPQDEDPRPHFQRLRELRDELGLRELSMGMSADWRAAVEEGATIVRVGRALFASGEGLSKKGS